jgi:maltose alpha-D-glucosyltransferase/alpha-amylase
MPQERCKWFNEDFLQEIKHFLPTKRWYGAKDEEIQKIEVGDKFILEETGGQLFTIIDVYLENGQVQKYSLPLAFDFDGKKADSSSDVFAKVECDGKKGVVFDGVVSDKFATKVVQEMSKGSVIERKDGGRVVFSSNIIGKEIIGKLSQDVQEKLISGEQSNSSIIIGSDLIIKFYRRVSKGRHPEVDTCRYLTEVADFKNAPQYLGSVESINNKGDSTAVAILQSFVRNQGDGWDNTVGYLRRFFEDLEYDHVIKPKLDESGRHAIFLAAMKTLGKRTAEMHQAFTIGGDEAFNPEPVTKEDIQNWIEALKVQAEKTKKALEKGYGDGLPDHIEGEVKEVLDNWNLVEAKIEELTPDCLDICKTRFHGDYHLGQVVVSDQGDYFLMDFEGEPLKPLHERHIKGPQMKDVAGMVRSFNYAAWGTLLTYTNDKEVRDRLLPWVEDWERKSVNAFLRGYKHAIKGCKAFPKDDKVAENLLDFFVLEKSLYEVVYEVANRPDWLPIPIMGVRRIIGLDRES